MNPIHFRKSRVLELDTAIRNGSDIPAPATGWTLSELIQVVGACHDRVRGMKFSERDVQQMIHIASELACCISNGEQYQQFDEDIAVQFNRSSRGGGLTFLRGVNASVH